MGLSMTFDEQVLDTLRRNPAVLAEVIKENFYLSLDVTSDWGSQYKQLNISLRCMDNGFRDAVLETSTSLPFSQA